MDFDHSAYHATKALRWAESQMEGYSDEAKALVIAALIQSYSRLDKPGPLEIKLVGTPLEVELKTGRMDRIHLALSSDSFNSLEVELKNAGYSLLEVGIKPERKPKEFKLTPDIPELADLKAGRERLIATLQTLKDKLNANIDPETEEIETLKQMKAQLEEEAKTEPDE